MILVTACYALREGCFEAARRMCTSAVTEVAPPPRRAASPRVGAESPVAGTSSVESLASGSSLGSVSSNPSCFVLDAAHRAGELVDLIPHPSWPMRARMAISKAPKP